MASRRRYNRPTRRSADFWNEEFDDPIPLPDGTELVTLHDAGLYIAALPERVHVLPDWQLAIKELHRAVTVDRNWMFFAWMAIGRAIHGSAPPLQTPRGTKQQRRHRER